MQDPSTLYVVTTTVGSPEQARALARALVPQRLAACVQLDESVQSFYRWEGRLCDEAEVRLTLKTDAARLPALRDFFAEEHPYDVPQFVAWPAEASREYAQWVRAELSPAPAGDPDRTS